MIMTLHTFIMKSVLVWNNNALIEYAIERTGLIIIHGSWRFRFGIILSGGHTMYHKAYTLPYGPVSYCKTLI